MSPEVAMSAARNRVGEKPSRKTSDSSGDSWRGRRVVPDHLGGVEECRAQGVEQARRAGTKAREVLTAALQNRKKEDSLLAEGERRLIEFTAKEQPTPSPFNVDVSKVSPDIKDEFRRMQDIMSKS